MIASGQRVGYRVQCQTVHRARILSTHNHHRKPKRRPFENLLQLMRRQMQQPRSVQSFRNRIAYRHLEFRHLAQEASMTIYNVYHLPRFAAMDLERHPQIPNHTVTAVTDREPHLRILIHTTMAVTGPELLLQIHRHIRALDQELLLQLHQDTTATAPERLPLLLRFNTFLIRESLRHQNQTSTLVLRLPLRLPLTVPFINLQALFTIGLKAITLHERNHHVHLLLVGVLDSLLPRFALLWTT